MTVRRTGEVGPVLGDGRKTYTNAGGANQLPAIAAALGAHADLPTAIALNGATPSDSIAFTPSIPLPDGVTGYAYCSSANNVQIRFVGATAGGTPAGWGADTTFNVSVI
jgi:hypothetical protein